LRKNNKMKAYNIIKNREGVWKLEEVGLNSENEPYIKHIRLSGDREKLEKLKKELENE